MTDERPYAIQHTRVEPRAEEMELVEYLIHRRSQACTNCGKHACWDELHEVWTFRSSRRLVPARGPLKPGIPIGVTKLQLREIPICSACAEMAPVTPIAYRDEQAWRETLARKAEETKAERAKPAPKEKFIPSLDSL